MKLNKTPQYQCVTLFHTLSEERDKEGACQSKVAGKPCRSKCGKLEEKGGRVSKSKLS